MLYAVLIIECKYNMHAERMLQHGCHTFANAELWNELSVNISIFLSKL